MRRPLLTSLIFLSADSRVESKSTCSGVLLPCTWEVSVALRSSWSVYTAIQVAARSPGTRRWLRTDLGVRPSTSSVLSPITGDRPTLGRPILPLQACGHEWNWEYYFRVKKLVSYRASSPTSLRWHAHGGKACRQRNI